MLCGKLFLLLMLNLALIVSRDIMLTLMLWDISNTDLVGNVVDCDVMHGSSVTLKKRMQVSPTMSETEDKKISHTFLPV